MSLRQRVVGKLLKHVGEHGEFRTIRLPGADKCEVAGVGGGGRGGWCFRADEWNDGYLGGGRNRRAGDWPHYGLIVKDCAMVLRKHESIFPHGAVWVIEFHEPDVIDGLSLFTFLDR